MPINPRAANISTSNQNERDALHPMRSIAPPWLDASDASLPLKPNTGRALVGTNAPSTATLALSETSFASLPTDRLSRTSTTRSSKNQPPSSIFATRSSSIHAHPSRLSISSGTRAVINSARSQKPLSKNLSPASIDPPRASRFIARHDTLTANSVPTTPTSPDASPKDVTENARFSSPSTSGASVSDSASFKDTSAIGTPAQSTPHLASHPSRVGITTNHMVVEPAQVENADIFKTSQRPRHKHMSLNLGYSSKTRSTDSSAVTSPTSPLSPSQTTHASLSRGRRFLAIRSIIKNSIPSLSDHDAKHQPKSRSRSVDVVQPQPTNPSDQKHDRGSGKRHRKNIVQLLGISNIVRSRSSSKKPASALTSPSALDTASKQLESVDEVSHADECRNHQLIEEANETKQQAGPSMDDLATTSTPSTPDAAVSAVSNTRSSDSNTESISSAPATSSQTLKDPTSQSAPSSLRIRTKNLVSYLGFGEASGPSKHGKTLILDEDTDDPALQEAFAIIRDYMAESASASDANQLRLYTQATKKIQKLLHRAKSRLQRTVRGVRDKNGAGNSTWSGTGSGNWSFSHLRSLIGRSHPVSDPGVNAFLDSVERRLEMEEEQDLKRSVETQNHEKLRKLSIEPVIVPKYGGTDNQASNRTDNQAKDIKALFDLDPKEKPYKKSEANQDTEDVVYGTSRYRVVDLVRSPDLTWDDLVYDAKRQVESGIQEESQTTLEYVSPRGSLAVPVSVSNRSSRATNRASATGPSGDSAQASIKALSDTLRSSVKQTTDRDADQKQEPLTSPLSAKTDTAAESGVDVDAILARILGDQSFKKTLFIGRMLTPQAQRDLLGEPEPNVSGADKPAHDGERVSRRLFDSDDDDSMDHLENDSDAEYDDDMGQMIDDLCGSDQESVESFTRTSPTWHDFSHFVKPLGRTFNQWRRRTTSTPEQETGDAAHHDSVSYFSDNDEYDDERDGEEAYDSDARSDSIGYHPLRRSNSETCDLFELELLFEQHRQRQRLNARRMRANTSSDSHASYTGTSNMDTGSMKSFSQSLRSSTMPFGPAQLAAVSLAAEEYLRSSRDKNGADRHARYNLSTNKSANRTSASSFDVLDEQALAQQLVARRERARAGMRALDRILNAKLGGVGPDSVPEHTWDDLAGVRRLSNMADFRSLIGFIFGTHEDDGDVLVSGRGADEMIPLGKDHGREADGNASDVSDEAAYGGQSQRSNMASEIVSRADDSDEDDAARNIYTYEQIWPASDEERAACAEAASDGEEGVARAVADALRTDVRY